MPGPNWITNAELAEIRSLQEDLISEIGGFCTVRHPTRVADGYGGWTNSFTDQLNVPVRLYIATGSKGQSRMGTAILGDQEKLETRCFLTFAWNVNVQVEDIVVFEGVSWRILDIQAPDSFITALRCRATVFSG